MTTGQHTVGIAWSTTESGLDGSKVYINKVTSESQVDLVEGYPKTVPAGVRTFTFEDLEHSTNYRISVTSLNTQEEEGPHSHLLCAVTNEHSDTEPVETKPIATNLRVESATKNSIALRWDSTEADFYKVTHQGETIQ
jgi:hypothetical protein